MYRWPWWIVLVLMVGLTACGSGSSGLDGSDNEAESSYTESAVPVFAPPPPGQPPVEAVEAVEEEEPNDDTTNAQILGEVRANEGLVIRGTIAPAGDHDVYRLALDGSQTLVLTLTHSSDANFDVILVSVVEDQTVLTCEQMESPEACAVTFLGNRDDLLITVVPVEGNGDYTLGIITLTP